MLKKFVLVTGALDILLGLAVSLPMLSAAKTPMFVTSFMTGGFLMFCGAVLMWASYDLVARGPVVFWQGLVRLFAVGAMLYAISAGLAGNETIPFLAMDAIVGPVYLIGITLLLRLPPQKIFLGMTTTKQRT